MQWRVLVINSFFVSFVIKFNESTATAKKFKTQKKYLKNWIVSFLLVFVRFVLSVQMRTL